MARCVHTSTPSPTIASFAARACRASASMLCAARTRRELSLRALPLPWNGLHAKQRVWPVAREQDEEWRSSCSHAPALSSAALVPQSQQTLSRNRRASIGALPWAARCRRRGQLAPRERCFRRVACRADGAAWWRRAAPGAASTPPGTGLMGVSARRGGLLHDGPRRAGSIEDGPTGRSMER